MTESRETVRRRQFRDQAAATLPTLPNQCQTCGAHPNRPCVNTITEQPRDRTHLVRRLDHAHA